MKAHLKETAYSHIRSKVLAGTWQPGSRLSHRQLAQEIGVSSTPIRDAVNRLVTEGILVSHPRMGTFVMELSRQELEELYDVREALESAAAANVAKKGLSGESLRELEKHHAEMLAIVERHLQNGEQGGRWRAEEGRNWRLMDAAFHVAILRASGNRRALKIVNDLRIMAHIFARRGTLSPLGDARQICDMHARLLDAMRNGDHETARQVMAEHIRSGRDLALEAYDHRRLEYVSEEALDDSDAVSDSELADKIHHLEEETETE